jgi:membrane protein implicated in regulation of membrane protease activity
MLWWHWLAGGLVLLVVELVTPSGFFIMFFGLGAMAVGLLMLGGLATSAVAQWLMFTALSLAFLFAFRGRVQRTLERPKIEIDQLVGDLAVPQQRIEAGAVGKVEVRGTGWSARNEGTAAIETGQRCRVVRVNGLELSVKPE